MSVVTLVQLSPRRAADGVAQTLRYCHNARISGRFFGEQWQPNGIDRLPEFELDLGFADGKFGQGATPTVGQLVLTIERESPLASMIWKGSQVTLRSAPWPAGFADPADADFGGTSTYTVEAVSISAEGLLTLTLLDNGQPLRNPLQHAKFGTTADPLLDGAGAADHAGKPVPVGWGRLRGVPALLVDRVYNIWLLIARPTSVFHGVYDGGAPFAVGAVRADLAALRANVPADGACDVCGNAGGLTLVRPWTESTYPLTADITASGPLRAGEIALAVVAMRSAIDVSAGSAAFDALYPAPCGIYVADETTAAAALDRLTAGLGAYWAVRSWGALELGRLDWSAPVRSFAAHELISIEREGVVMPNRRRAVGWGHNNRVHSEAEIVGILRAGDIEGLGALALMDGVDWSLVSGAGRPESGATRNLDGGGNMIRDPVTGSDWSYFGLAQWDGHESGAAVYDRWRAVIPAGALGGYVTFGPADPLAILERFPVEPGTTYHAVWWGFREIEAGDGIYMVNGYDAAGAYITTLAVADTRMSAEVGGTWARRGGRFVIPAGWAAVLPHVGHNGGAGNLYIAYPYWGRVQPGADVTGDNTALNTLHVGAAMAEALVSDAASAKANAASAQSAISIITSDGYLSRDEKPSLIREWTAVEDEYAVLHARTVALGQAGNPTWADFHAARIALGDYLSGLSPAWNNMGADTPVVGATFRGRWTDYYYARQLVLDLFVSVTQATADSKTRNVDRGAWVSLANGEALIVGDEVQDQGSTWGCILAHAKSAGNGPPTLPTASNTYWRLRAAKGSDGDPGVTAGAVAPIQVAALSNGTIKAGALPQTRQLVLIQGASNVTGSASWSVLGVPANVSIGVDSAGLVTLTNLTADNGSAVIRAVLAGANFDFAVPATKVRDGSPAVAVGTPLSFPGSGSLTVLGTTGDMALQAGVAVTVALNAAWESSSGTSTGNFLAQYSADAGASWISMGAAEVAAAPALEPAVLLLSRTLAASGSARIVRFRAQGSMTNIANTFGAYISPLSAGSS